MSTRVLIVGNSGSGKTTLARTLAHDRTLAHLDLDPLAWAPGYPPVRRRIADSLGDVARFTVGHDRWVIEGCYADLLRALIPQATELIFLNPGTEACVRNCLARPWEPHKYASAAEQARQREPLLQWVREYAIRDDACSLAAHRRLFDEFPRSKREIGEESTRPDAALDTQIAGARAYDALFVPSLIGPWAPIVAEAAAIATGDLVLDVACGTGLVAREAAGRTGPGGRTVGLDLNPGMLAVAREQAPELEWRHGSADALPFADGSFDVVTCQFGLMFFPDRRRALAEMRRVLRPGGRLAVAVWDALPSMPVFDAEVALFERRLGPAAADALRAPFVLGDRTALASLFADAGIAGATIETRSRTASFPAVRVLVEADLRGWLPIMGVTPDEDAIAATLAETDAALGPLVSAGPDGVSFPTSAHVVRATCGWGRLFR